MHLQYFCRSSGPTPHAHDCGLASVTTWLQGITKPVETEASLDVNDWSIEFVISSSAGRNHVVVVGEEQPGGLGDIAEAIGIDLSQLAVDNDTVDFNVQTPAKAYDHDWEECTLQVHSITDRTFGICWTFDPIHRATRGFIFHINDEGHRSASYVLESLTALAPDHSHSLLPALLTLEIEHAEMRVWVDEQLAILMRLQIQTGHHYYSYAPFHDEDHDEEHDDGSDSVEPDLTLLSRKAGGIAVNITTSTLCLQRILDLADFVLDEARMYEQNARSAPQPGHRSQTIDMLINRASTAKRCTKGLLAESEASKHKAMIVVQTMLSLTAQQDQRLSMGIAEDSRTLARKATRDSTSMKAIAAVTMCFLPGTFVASLLAMPMFDWHEGVARSVNRHFWIYWAVTLPLTALVICAWLAWTNKRTLWKAKEKNIAHDARKGQTRNLTTSESHVP